MKKYITETLEACSDNVKKSLFAGFLLIIGLAVLISFNYIENVRFEGESIKIDGMVLAEDNRGFSILTPGLTGMDAYDVISSYGLLTPKAYYVFADKKSEFNTLIADIQLKKGINQIYFYYNRIERIDAEGKKEIFRNEYVDDYYSNTYSDLSTDGNLLDGPKYENSIFKKGISEKFYLERVKLFTVYFYLVITGLFVLIAKGRTVHFGFLFLIAAMIKDIDFFTLSMFNQLDLILSSPVTTIFPFLAMLTFSIILVRQLYLGIKNIKQMTYYDIAITITLILLTSILV